MRPTRRVRRTVAVDDPTGTVGTVGTATRGAVPVPLAAVRRLMNRSDDLGLAVEDLAESCERVHASTTETSRAAAAAGAATGRSRPGPGRSPPPCSRWPPRCARWRSRRPPRPA